MASMSGDELRRHLYDMHHMDGGYLRGAPAEGLVAEHDGMHDGSWSFVGDDHDHDPPPISVPPATPVSDPVQGQLNS